MERILLNMEVKHTVVSVTKSFCSSLTHANSCQLYRFRVWLLVASSSRVMPCYLAWYVGTCKRMAYRCVSLGITVSFTQFKAVTRVKKCISCCMKSQFSLCLMWNCTFLSWLLMICGMCLHVFSCTYLSEFNNTFRVAGWTNETPCY